MGVTKNVTLQCKYDNQDNGRPRITEMLGILIHKYHGSDRWITKAKIRIGNQDVTLGDDIEPGVTAKGHVGKIQDSYLTMTWSVSSSNTTGQYACEINGYAKDDNLIKIVTDPLSIVESQLSLNYLFSMVLDLKEQTEKNRKESSKTIYSIQQLEERIYEDIDILRRDVNATREFVNTKQKGGRAITKAEIGPIVDSKLQDNWYERRNWPGGQYALLNTEGGCPKSTTTEWSAGYIKFHSESKQGERDDAASEPNHLAKPVFGKNGTNNFVYIRTCKRATKASGPAWPKGSYCIHRAGGSCPTGFKEGKVQMDAEDNPRLRGDFKNAPDFQMDTSFDFEILFFCCRNDEDPTTPIILPVDKPFYLYRYKGMCQTVKDVKVSGEWLQIDTENHANHDKYYTNVVPDSTLNPLRFLLCYYSK